MLEPVSAQIDLVLRHRVKHERVIRIWGMPQGKDFSPLLLHLRFLRYLSGDFRHRARGIWRAKLCDANELRKGPRAGVLKRSRSSRSSHPKTKQPPRFRAAAV